LTRASARDRAVVPLLCVALAALAVSTRHRGHHGDVALFRVWFLSFVANPRLVYLDHAADVNYGALGLLTSTLAGWFARASASDFHATHKLMLAPWLIASAWLFLRLARRLGVTRPERTTCLFVALPCTWVGGLYFGQIDAVPLFFLLAAAEAGFVALENAGSVRGRTALAGLGVASCLALLTKPLALFSLPALVLLSLTVLARTHRRAGARAAWLDASALAASGLVLFVPDLFFAVPRGHLCHVWHVYRWAGPPHGEMVGNGAAIWAFLGWSPDAPSRDSFAHGLTPRGVGLALFGLALAWITAVFLRVALKNVASDDAPRAITAGGLLHAGMTQLAMSLFLAGTHERYAFLAWAPLLLALAARPAVVRHARLVTGGVAVAAAFQGLFVLSTIEWHAFDSIVVFRSTRIAAVLTLVAFGSVLALLRSGRTPV
jgi:hypothetical protein